MTSTDTAKVDEIERDARVGVCCLRARDRAYVSISARATVERDAATIRRLWKPDWSVWFHSGPDDPSLALLELWVERGILGA